jgi:hypothetical protein
MNNSTAYIKSQAHFMEHRDLMLKDMKWSTPKASRSKKDITKDIGISINGASTTKAGKTLLITLRNEVDKIIDGSNIGRIGVCVKGDRMFIQAMSGGYSLSRYGKRVSSKIYYEDMYEPFIGQHDLQYDDFLDLYYIDKEG